MRILKKAFFIAIIAVAVAGCTSSTKLVRSYSDKENTPKSFEKLGVAVLLPSESNRYVIERAVAEKLRDRDINAMATYDIFPFAGRMGELTEGKSSDAVRQIVIDKITENNFDGFMIISLFDEQREERWVSDHPMYMNGTGYFGTPYGMAGTYYDYYYYSMGGGYYNQGSYVEHVTYFLECLLFDVSSEKLIWRGETKSVNIQSVEAEAQSFAEVVGHELIFKKVITP